VFLASVYYHSRIGDPRDTIDSGDLLLVGIIRSRNPIAIALGQFDIPGGGGASGVYNSGSSVPFLYLSTSHVIDPFDISSVGVAEDYLLHSSTHT
jgi:hypothetical protein